MDLEQVVLPELGEGVEDAKVLKIRKKIGDTVHKNEVVAEVATDKVDSEIEAQVAGRVVHVGCQEGETIKVGQTILSIQVGAEEGVSGLEESQASPANITPSIPAPNPVAQTATGDTTDTTTQAKDAARVVQGAGDKLGADLASRDNFLSPLVSSMVAQHGISTQELADIQGTGLHGRVRKADILHLLEQRNRAQNQPPLTTATTPPPPEKPIPEKPLSEKSSAPLSHTPDSQLARGVQTAASSLGTPLGSPDSNPHIDKTGQGLSFYDNSYAAIDRESYAEFFQDKPKDSVEIVSMSRMRSVIAEHMRTSLDTSAHATLFGEADVTDMVKWREAEKHKFSQQYAEKLTYTHLIFWIVAQILPRFPLLNSSIDKQNIILKKNINLGMATALPSGDLIVPVVKNADRLGFVALVAQCNSLAKKARNNRLKFTDIEGGTFTISSIGSFGALHGTPIIQQPQVALLVAGAIKSKATVCKYEGQNVIVPREIMHLSFGFDHRIIDGMLAGSFLQACCEKLENFTAPELS